MHSYSTVDISVTVFTTGGIDSSCQSISCLLARGSSLRVYGANVDQIKAQIGAAVSPAEVEKALRLKKYKILTLTHVDTSTGVLSDPKTIAETVKRVSPDTLVCS